jgi:hypothetical protein
MNMMSKDKQVDKAESRTCCDSSKAADSNSLRRIDVDSRYNEIVAIVKQESEEIKTLLESTAEVHRPFTDIDLVPLEYIFQHENQLQIIWEQLKRLKKLDRKDIESFKDKYRPALKDIRELIFRYHQSLEQGDSNLCESLNTLISSAEKRVLDLACEAESYANRYLPLLKKLQELTYYYISHEAGNLRERLLSLVADGKRDEAVTEIKKHCLIRYEKEGGSLSQICNDAFNEFCVDSLYPVYDPIIEKDKPQLTLYKSAYKDLERRKNNLADSIVIESTKRNEQEKLSLFTICQSVYREKCSESPPHVSPVFDDVFFELISRTS